MATLNGPTALQNDTFSENNADDMGGGISVNGGVLGKSNVLASFITVAYNKATRGGGIAVYGGKMKIKNSIVAYSPMGKDCSTVGGTFSGVADNLNSDGSCAGFTFTEDPLLDVLANYGGSTQTHALRTGSPAINTGVDCTNLFGTAVTLDQRNFPRPVGPACDLGSYESAEVLPSVSINTVTPTSTSTATPEPATSTPTPEPPTITANKNANCRYGPGMLYEIADTLMKGQSAVVVGRNEDNTWWQIKGPRYGTLCWVAHTTVDESGPVDGVPIGVAPEEPTISKTPRRGCLVNDVTGAQHCVVPCPENLDAAQVCTP